MAKKRKSSQRSKPKRKTPARPRPKPQDNVVLLRTYEITDEPMEDPEVEKLPLKDQQRIAEIAERFPESPADYVEELETLVAEFPQIPKLYNFLSVAYKSAGRFEDASRLIEETCEKFPDYLFGKTNRAVELIFEGRAKDVLDVLGGTFDLAMLYPGRQVYHVSEMTAFFSMMALYLYATGEEDRARLVYTDLLQTLDTDDRLVQFVGSLFDENPLIQAAARAQIRRRPRRKKS